MRFGGFSKKGGRGAPEDPRENNNEHGMKGAPVKDSIRDWTIGFLDEFIPGSWIRGSEFHFFRAMLTFSRVCNMFSTAGPLSSGLGSHSSACRKKVLLKVVHVFGVYAWRPPLGTAKLRTPQYGSTAHESNTG